jgi:hypothetical protein
MKISKTDIAWAAGFIDGEGCIAILKNKNKNPCYIVSLQVVQKFRRPLDRLVTIFGGEVKFHNPKRYDGYFYWYLYSDNAVEVLEQILPYLVAKEKQAKVAIEFQARRLPRGVVKSVRYIARDEKDYLKLRSLKVQ